MKNLMILLLLTISSMCMASVDLGGTLKSKDGRVKFSCSSVIENVCQEIIVDVAYFDENDFHRYNSLRVEPMELTREAFREATRDLNRFYYGAGLVGAAIGGTVCGLGGGPVACFGLLPLGIALDIVKAPIVGVAYVGHKLGDLITKRRFKRHFKHLMNPKKKGKSKRISKRDFQALLETF